MTRRVTVEAPARVHFGMLDLSGSLGRRFGGIGAGIHPPGVALTASHAQQLTVSSDVDGGVAREVVEEGCAASLAAARAVLAHYGIDRGVHLTLQRLLPAHHGLGSGTQISLASARAVAELFDLPGGAGGLATIVGRAQRSAIGTYVFEQGGFILEGGRRPGVDRLAPLLSRLPIPPSWRCVLALPSGGPGLSGATEAAAFAALPRPPEHDAERVAHLVLMALLPALADADFDAFAAALSEIQQLNGRWFSAAQGGAYAAGGSTALVEVLTAWGLRGVGQSSWGPAVYALASDPDVSASLARRVSVRFPSALVLDATFTQEGARTTITQ